MKHQVYRLESFGEVHADSEATMEDILDKASGQMSAKLGHYLVISEDGMRFAVLREEKNIVTDVSDKPIL